MVTVVENFFFECNTCKKIRHANDLNTFLSEEISYEKNKSSGHSLFIRYCKDDPYCSYKLSPDL